MYKICKKIPNKFLDDFTVHSIICDAYHNIMVLGESCRDWPSSLIGPVLHVPYYCIPWHPLSIISLTSGISDDTVSFDEIAVLF